MALVTLPSSTEWAVAVTLGGVNVSDRLTGRLRIEAEENAARVAEFTLLPVGGPVAVSDYVGQTVAIDITQDATAYRRFTGIVDHPRYDPATRLLRFSCTDARQTKLQAMSPEEVDALIPVARWSADIFDPDVDGLQHANNLLSTLPVALDLDTDGETWLLTDWAAKAEPDFEFDSVLDGSLSVQLAERRYLVNEVDVALDYRFTRQRHRKRSWQWAWVWPPGAPADFCTWFQDTTELPDKDMIQRAAEGGGWTPDPTSFSYAELPPTGGPPVCGNFSVGWINRGVPVVLGASWEAARRMTQAVTEEYRLTVRAPQSITRHGVIPGRQRGVAVTEFDAGDWERDPAIGIPAGFAQDALGDYILDNVDRAQSDNAIETVLHAAWVQILAAHRRNFVSWQWPGLVAGLSLVHTVEVDTDGVMARGKLVQLIEEMDLDSASLVSTVRIAVSRAGSTGSVSADALTAPAAPDTTPQEEAA